MRPIRLATALTALTILHLAPIAAAQPDDPAADPGETEPVVETPEHERLLEEARTELGRGNTDKACDLFAASNQAQANEDVQFELGQCWEMAGEKAKAATVFEQVAAGGGARAAEGQRRATALREQLAAADAPAEEPAEEGAAVTAPPAEEPKTAEPSAYHFSDFVDTRLTWTFGDDDVLHATGETVPLSPNASIGDRKPYRLFFDNLNSQFGGRENLTHLVLYKKMPGFIDRLDTEASMVLRVDMASLAAASNNLNSTLYDAGSYIRVFVRTGDKDDDKTGLGVTLFPIDTDRFRLGYLYDISWGGTNPRINQSIFPRIQGSSPGFKIQFNHPIFYAYGGMKTAQIVQVQEILTPGTSEVEVVRIGEANYGFLGGAGVELFDYVNVDAGGGYFQQGKFDLPDVLGEQVYTFGLSSRLAVHSKNSGVVQSADFSLYRNDPMKADRELKVESYPDDVSWTVSVEYSNLWQNLKDFDVPGQTTLQQARAAALQGTVKVGYFRASLAGIYRDLPFVLRNVPSFIPFETLPGGNAIDVSDELFFAGSVDYHFDGPRLTPGIGAGVQLPASVKTSSINAANQTIGRTVVIRQQGDQSILPVDAEAVPIFQARASLKWDLSQMLSTVIWAQFVRDNNATFVERDPNEGTVATRQFVSPNFLGLGGSAQARF